MSKLENLLETLCPDGVEYKRLEEVCCIETGEQLNKEKLKEKGLYPVMNGGIYPSGYWDESNTEKNTIIISQGGASAGYTQFMETPFWAGAHCYKVSLKSEKVNYKFLYYFIKNNQTNLIGSQKGAGIPSVSRTTLYSLKIPVPPIEVQKEIVKILDNFTMLSAELSEKLSAELTARKKQYEFYRDKLLTFDKTNVEYKHIWELTAWDKNFNAVDKYKQKKVIDYHYFLAGDLKSLIKENGKIKILTTNVSELYTDEALVQDYIAEGEIVCIPWGGNPIVQYYKGKFVTADNRIATSLDTSTLDNKFLYYCLINRLQEIASFYRGSGIKHPSMAKVLDMQIPLPPLDVQERIVNVLDNFDKICSDLKIGLPSEIEKRQQQYEYYRDKLLTFKEKV